MQPLTYISSIKGLRRRSAGDVVSPGNALPPALRRAGVLLQGSNQRSGSRLNLSVPLMLGSALAFPLVPRAPGARESLRVGRPMMPPFGVPSERNTSKVSWLSLNNLASPRVLATSWQLGQAGGSFKQLAFSFSLLSSDFWLVLSCPAHMSVPLRRIQ